MDSDELGTIAVAVALAVTADALDATFVDTRLIDGNSDDRGEDIVSSLSRLIDG